jgi:hypothetical protein
MQYFIQNLTYSPNDTVNTIYRLNAVLETIEMDPHSMPRPRSYTFSNWSGCQPVAIAPINNPTIGTGEMATLSVQPISGTGGYHYQWYDGPISANHPIYNATSSVFITPPLTSNYTYGVVVSNDCNTIQSEVLVTVSNCTSPVITGQSSSQTISSGQSISLSVTATGSSPLTYTWYKDGSAIGSGATFQTPPATATSTYTVQVSNSCGSVNGQPIVLTVPLAAPYGLVATATTSSTVTLTWAGAATGVHHYDIERRAAAGIVHLTSTTTSLSDSSSIAADKVYVYRVRAVAADGTTMSDYSAADLATTRSFSPLIRYQTTVALAHMTELYNAVNDVYAVTGHAVTWSDILPAGVAAPSSSGPVLLTHLTSLRTAMNNALSLIPVATSSYTSPPSPAPIIIDYILEIRSRVQ